MTTLTKQDLVIAVMVATNSTKTKAKIDTDNLIDVVKTAIFNRETVYFPGLTKLVTRIEKARPGRNPKTGEDMVIAQRHSIRATSVPSNVAEGKLVKTVFIKRMQDKGNTSSEATNLVTIFYNFIEQISTGSYRIEIRGLGTFMKEAGRKLRNPKTGESTLSKLSYRPTFRCSPSLRITMDKEYLV